MLGTTGRAGPSREFDAVIVGSGPNGLVAGIDLARKGLAVVVLEAGATVGGGLRTADLTLPGFAHDVCSAIHPFVPISPALCDLDLEGLSWIRPPRALAHPLDEGPAAILDQDQEVTSARLEADGGAYRRLVGPFVPYGAEVVGQALDPLHWPRHPLAMMRFGWYGLGSVEGLVDRWFAGVPARALFAGLAGHSFLSLDETPTAAVALMFALAGHHNGWPFPAGGSGALAGALAGLFRRLGGEIRTSCPVASMVDIPGHRVVLFDLIPAKVVEIVGELFPSSYRRRLERFRPGPSIFKLDWALDGPIPWRDPEVGRAGTVHVGGTFEEIARAEAAMAGGRVPDRPFVLVAQNSAFDPSRAPAGRQVGWGYCHVPHGCPQDMTEVIESQIERFAPGFRDRILARHAMGPAWLESYNANYRRGDITGGAMDLRQLFTRPVARLVPWATPHPAIFLCSASTPPGPGVHGMCGHLAARAAWRRVLRRTR